MSSSSHCVLNVLIKAFHYRQILVPTKARISDEREQVVPSGVARRPGLLIGKIQLSLTPTVRDHVGCYSVKTLLFIETVSVPTV